MSNQVGRCFKAALLVMLHRREGLQTQTNTGWPRHQYRRTLWKPLASVVMIFGFGRMLYLCIGSWDQRLAWFYSSSVSFQSLDFVWSCVSTQPRIADVSRLRHSFIPTRRVLLSVAENAAEGDAGILLLHSFPPLSLLVGALWKIMCSGNAIDLVSPCSRKEASFIFLKIQSKDEKNVHVL